MNNIEFSSGFDIQYNNISSNQAPGLDDYEKSFFLTKAQDEILKAYLNPKGNKLAEGIDDSSIRQMVFSKLITTYYATSKPKEYITAGFNGEQYIYQKQEVQHLYKYEQMYDQTGNPISNNYSRTEVPEGIVTDAKYDSRSNSKSVNFPSDILSILNEQIIVKRDNVNVTLQGIPVSYLEYQRLMNKSYKRPLKNQAWRLFVDSDNTVDIIVGPSDTIEEYKLRYVRKPKPIILSPLSGITIDGESNYSECELDPMIHKEILQRAVELAKAAYNSEGLQSLITVGNTSGTNLGIIPNTKE